MRHSAAMLHSVLAHAGDRESTSTSCTGPASTRRRPAARRDGAARGGGVIAPPRGSPTTGRRPAGRRRVHGGDVVPDLPARAAAGRRPRPVPRRRHARLDDLGRCGRPTSATPTSAPSRTSSSTTTSTARRELGLAEPQVYFNSGVLLMNLDAMRRDGSRGRCASAPAPTRSASAWPDQDALNLVLGPRRLPLHPRWNAMNSVLRSRGRPRSSARRRSRRRAARPGIRHFEGPGSTSPGTSCATGIGARPTSGTAARRRGRRSAARA